jgi:predicted amidohydrolase YtcJ
VFDEGLVNKDHLDAVAPNVPVYLVHVSGHLGVANGAVLKAAGIDRNTPAPGLGGSPALRMEQKLK